MSGFDPKKSGSKGPRPLFPANKYLFNVNHAEKTLSNKGTPRISFRLTIAAGPHEGRKWTEDCYLTDGASWKLGDFCKACGITEEFDTDDAATLINTFADKKLFVTLIDDEYETTEDGRTTVKKTLKSTAYDSTVPSKREPRRDKDTENSNVPTTGDSDQEGTENEVPF